ncbi:MAG: hypothetical protein ACWGOV_09055 [Acidiferrobacterales bacterium]
MKYYLKEWADDNVSVIDEQGQVVGNFISIEDAIEAYDWHDVEDDEAFQASVDISSIAI